MFVVVVFVSAKDRKQLNSINRTLTVSNPHHDYYVAMKKKRGGSMYSKPEEIPRYIFFLVYKIKVQDNVYTTMCKKDKNILHIYACIDYFQRMTEEMFIAYGEN